ncbi:MFS transporter [Actinopolymorpha singaporensis]|uniref:Putative proline/betaine transporter n=1 Tax=Actinopolymorpha singaporensis TaxID=117157 RepID=A0A1H1LMN1_9ACTN|nr:MFS transporter [Actinopolymorpha singaporensis]SDR75139.1 MFS transporter, MHS family, proline/betaine transporter [Actinopolymorpha singaporensis]
MATAENGRDITLDDVTVTDESVVRRAVTAASIGNFTEWYDFGVYSYLTAIISKVFFADLSPGLATVATLGTFAVSFLVRPFGGLVFGPLGDRIGRTKVLATTVILMACGTTLLGLVPSYAAIGVAAPLLVLFARLVQGFSTGGEYAGAMTFIAEYAPDRRRGFLGSWLEFGTLTGYTFGALLVTLLTTVLGDSSMQSWGWRIPFLLALPIGLVGLYLRMRLEETPAFEQLVEKSEHHEGTSTRDEFRLIFTRHWRALLLVGGLVIAWNVTNYMLTSYMPTYLTTTLPRHGKHGTTTGASNVLQIVVLVLLMVVVTFLGRLSDRVGRRPILMTGSLALVVLGLPMVLLLQVGGIGPTFLGLMVMGLSLVCFSSTAPSTLPAMFPTEIRYGGLSIAFNIFVSAFGGTTAAVMGALILATGNLLWPGYYLIGAGVIGAVCVYFVRESARRPLAGSNPAVSTEEEARELVAQAQADR